MFFKKVNLLLVCVLISFLVTGCGIDESGSDLIGSSVERYIKDIDLNVLTDDVSDIEKDEISDDFIDYKFSLFEDDYVNYRFDDYNGFIVELEYVPIVVKRQELIERYSGKMEFNEKLIQTSVDNYALELSSFRSRVKEDIFNILSSVKNEDSLSIDDIFGLEFEYVFNGFFLNVDFAQAELIRNVRGVKAVYKNMFVESLLIDSVPLIQEGILSGNLDANGDDCTISGLPCLTGEGVKIAILDTGVDYTHSDLGGCLGEGCKVIGGYDFVNNNHDPMDDHGHGTHCASIAAGDGALKGVAPGASILAYKVLNDIGSGNWNQVIAGIEQAVLDGADILSLSLGGRGNPDDPVSQAVDNAVLAGSVVVVSAGNSGPGSRTIRSPGTARHAITVGATNKNKNVARFSSKGPVVWLDESHDENYLIKPDIFAPGVDICAAQWNDWSNHLHCYNSEEHIEISGTSMSAPHISGAIALMKQKKPYWNPDDFKDSIKGTANIVVDFFSGFKQEYFFVNLTNFIKLEYPLTNFWDFGIVNSQRSVLNCLDLVEIKGIFPDDYSTLIVEYYDQGEWHNDGIEIVGSNNIFATFDPGGFCGDTYEFRVKMTAHDVTRSDYVSLFFDESLKQGWPVLLNYNMGGNFMLALLYQPIISDLTGDGKKELIFAYGEGNDAKISVFKEDGSQLEGFPLYLLKNEGLPGAIQTRPIIVDVQGEDHKTIFVFGGDMGSRFLFRVNYDGSYEKALDNPLPNEFNLFSDYFGEGSNKNIFGVDTGYRLLYLFDNNMDFYNDAWPLSLNSFSNSGIWRPELFSSDVDNSGVKELIVFNVDDQETFIYAFDIQGNLVQGWPKNHGERFRCSFKADFDKDGKEELICYDVEMSSNGNLLKIFVLSFDGEIKYDYEKFIGGSDVFDVSIADIHDERNIVINLRNNTNSYMYLLNVEGLFEEIKTDRFINSMFYPIGNLCEDYDVPYIFSGSNTGVPKSVLSYLNKYGVRKDFFIDRSNIGSAISDFTGDGKNELVTISRNGWIYLRNTQGLADHQWGEPFYDAYNSNCFNCGTENCDIDTALIVTVGNGGTVLVSQEDTPSGAPQLLTTHLNPHFLPYYDVCSYATLTAVPSPGFTFNTWLNEIHYPIGSSENITLHMTHNRLITATFTENVLESVSLIISIEGEGFVKSDVGEVSSEDSMFFDKGSRIKLKAVPDSDWEFVRWLGYLDRPSISSNELIFDIDKDMRLTAVFEKKID